MEQTNNEVKISTEVSSLIPVFNGGEPESKKKSISKVAKHLLGISSEELSGVIPAEDAYIRSTYGTWTTKKAMLKSLISEINSTIKMRIENGKIYAVISIIPEIMNYANQIADTYKTYGYQVYVLNKDTLKLIDDTLEINNTRTMLLFMWDKVY